MSPRAGEGWRRPSVPAPRTALASGRLDRDGLSVAALTGQTDTHYRSLAQFAFDFYPALLTLGKVLAQQQAQPATHLAVRALGGGLALQLE